MRADIGVDFVAWLDADLLLLSEPATTASADHRRLVIQHLDGRWRTLAPDMAFRQYGLGPVNLAAVNDHAGVLSR